MPSLLIRHVVTDFAVWRSVFSEHVASQRAYGSRSGRVYRSGDDPSEIWLLLEWDDLSRARLYARSVDLDEATIRAGVVNQPEYWFLEEVGLLPPEPSCPVQPGAG